MSIIESVIPRKTWRNSAGRLWGWVMQRNDNRLVQQIPNFLSVSRLAAAVAGFISYQQFTHGHITGAWIWLTATIVIFGLTDYLDGKAARSLKVISTFGKLVDPITDKIGTCTMFFLFLGLIIRPGYTNPALIELTGMEIVFIFLLQAFLIGAALSNYRNGCVPGANSWGKWKLRVEGSVLTAGFVLVYSTAYGFPRVIAPTFMAIASLPVIVLCVKSLEGHLNAQRADQTTPERP
jgi:phosphatidylglycerophosphate synthase